MLTNSSQVSKRDNSSLRRRKPMIAGAGVKHRLNGLSALSALNSSSLSSGKRRGSLSVTMSKPIRTVTKKRQDNYVIKLGNQQLMQQFTKSGSSVVVNGDQDTDIQSLTLQQKVKVFFVLLMIPSAMMVFFGGDKFNNKSSITIDPNVQLMGAMGGMGGINGMGGLAGLAGMAGFPQGIPGFGGHQGGGHQGGGRGGYHDEGRGRHPYDRMRRNYDEDSMEDRK